MQEMLKRKQRIRGFEPQIGRTLDRSSVMLPIVQIFGNLGGYFLKYHQSLMDVSLRDISYTFEDY